MTEATLRRGQRLRPPPVPRRMITRERVLAAIDAAGPTPVVCLRAPGGYGKTTTLAQWAARDPRPAVWLTVRPAAADPHWLAQALLDSLHDAGLVGDRTALPGHVGLVSWHLHTLPIVERLLSSVAEPFVVVVDDAGAIAGPAWEALVESLASCVPPGSTVAMSTRGSVPSTLWRLHARGLVCLLGPEVLAFDEDETHSLMQLLGVDLAPHEVVRVLQETGGWPAALYLAGLSARSRAAAPLSPSDITGLDEYLRAEIIARLAPEDARFLERASVLTVLDKQGCEALTGAPDSLSRLRRLASVNHLLAPQDRAGNRFRIHPLLAQLLEDDLHGRDPDGWRSAHEAASLVEERRGDLDSAVHHAKLSGDDDRLSALVWPHTAEHLGHGRWAVVQRWLAGLDEERLRGRCGLALSAAWTAFQAGDITGATRLALTASARATDGDPTLRPYVTLLEATIGADGPESIEAAARSVIAALPADDRWQTLAHYLLGATLVLREERRPGVEAFEEGRRRSEALDVPILRALCLAGLADVALMEGDEHKALALVREVRAIASTHRLDTVVTTAPAFTTSAVGYVVEGRFADARKESARALRHIALMADTAPWHAVQGRLALAHVSLALGDPQHAKVLLDEAADARGPATASPVLDRLYTETAQQLSRVTTSLVGSSALTTAEVRVLQYLPTHLSFPQIADELVVSRHTVKTQAMSAYRKLGVHTRTEAIERARRAGLLPPG